MEWTGNYAERAVESSEVNFTSALGDLRHREDVLLTFGVNTSVIERFLSISHLSDWLKENYPDFVPPDNPNGQSPSDRTIAGFFKYYYYISVSLRVSYLKWLRTQV